MKEIPVDDNQRRVKKARILMNEQTGKRGPC